MRFYFDFISPYAYIAWTQIHALANAHGRSVEPIPVLFAGLLNHWGHKGPAEIPPKRVYVFKDVLRTAHVLDIPLAPPPAHPFRPLLSLRVASLEMEPDTRRQLIDALFASTWAGGPGVEDPDVVGRIAADLGIDDAVERAAHPDAKARVRTQTDDAIEAGVFGIPSIVCDGELFWGYDSFGHLDRFLDAEDPLPDSEALLAAWASVAPSASR